VFLRLSEGAAAIETVQACAALLGTTG